MRIVPSLLFVTFSLIMSGCALDASLLHAGEQSINTQEHVVLRGTVKSLGHSSVNGSNLIFRADDGKVYSLISESITEKYINQELEIDGTLLQHNQLSTPRLEVNSFNFIHHAQSGVTVLEHWKPLFSSRNRFEIIRKNTWVPHYNDRIITLYIPPALDAVYEKESYDRFIIETIPLASDTTISDWITHTYNSLIGMTQKKVTDSQLTAYSFDTDHSLIFIIDGVNGFLYRISYERSAESSNFTHKNVFYEMIQSFAPQKNDI